jgi:hypothetical protein
MLDFFNHKYKTRFIVILHTTKKMIDHVEDDNEKEKYRNALATLLHEGNRRFDRWWIPEFYLNKRKSEAVYSLMGVIRDKIEREKNHFFG